MSASRNTLSLSKAQLEHVRDLMTIVLGQRGVTLSSQLAASESRLDEEAKLWQSVYTLCEAMGVDVGGDAPDFGVIVTSIPEMSVIRMRAIVEADDDDA